MGKRKQTTPRHADEAKRQQLHWNMDTGSSGENSFICDHTLKNENLNQSESTSESPSSSTSVSTEGSSGAHLPIHALCVDAFYQNLAFCHSTLTLYNSQLKGLASSSLLEFGSFKVSLVARPKLTPLPDQLPEFKECWLYLADGDNPSMLYFETEDNNENVIQQKRTKSRQSKFGTFWFVSLNVPVAVLTYLKNKSFKLLCSKFDTDHKVFDVTIYGCETTVLHLSHPSEAIRIKVPQMAVQRLMEYYYDIHLPYNYAGRERTTGHDFFHLYESVMSIHMEQLSNDASWQTEVSHIGHDCLKPVLRQYQKQSVAWMLRQERCHKDDEQREEMHSLYCQVTLKDGKKLFYNRHGGSLIREKPKYVPSLPGGILADEMGLGKTVEVLCCMLLHPRPNVELPERLPVLEEPLSDSDENSRLSFVNENIGEDLTEKGKTYDPVEKHEDPNKVSGKLTENSGAALVLHLEQKDMDHPSLVTENAFDASVTDPLFCDAVNPVKDGLKSSTGENHSVSEALSLQHPENQNGSLTFLSSKTTSDLTGDAESESAEMDTSESSSGQDMSVKTVNNSEKVSCENFEVSISEKSKSLLQNDVGLNQGNKAVLEINANSQAATTVQKAENVSTVSSPNASAHETSSSDTELKTVPSFSETFNNDLPESSLLLNSLSNTHSEPAENNQGKERRKGKRKSKGYIEYVPVSDHDSNYFSTKPTARKQFFECNCGQLDSEDETRKKGLHTVKCNLCGMSQHAECMNYDLKDPFRGEYLCPHCHAVSSTIKSGATLIISPYSICHQWIEEISKHIKERSINVFIYSGVSKLGYIQPQTLAQQDIVITTYDVLRKEVDYVNLPHTNSETGRRFRHPKRFLATPSPMVAVEWWRICLDEAQMVECVTTKTAEMAMKLKAVNRWCVTGTPLMRSVEDIYGLLLFLGVDPLLVQQWFRFLVWEPFCHDFTAPMHHALSKILWRTAKKDVIDQINLPVQTEEVNWLTFSPVEEHFYRRQYEIYLRNAYAYRKRGQIVQDPNTKLHALDRKTMNELLSPLFRLRQACCHPQIVRGEFLPLNKTMMTMEELLEHMTKKVKTECEEAHRQIVASLNGMAGLFILRDKLSEAVEKYRDVLRSVEEHKDQFRTDDLQQLHAMHNLAEVLNKKPPGVSPTLRDGSLREECEELKKKYMQRTKVNFVASQEVLEITQGSIKDLSMKISSLDGDWWADIVDMTIQRGIDGDLIYKVKDDLVRTSTTEGTIADIFTNADGLMFVVDSHLQALTKARQTLTSKLDKLASDTSQSLVQEAALCCLRPVEEILKSCPFCKVDELFNEYESKLFLFVERGVTVTGDDHNLAYQVSTKRQGTWADSEVERGLKSILAFYRQHFDVDHDILEAASLQIKYLDTLKKEFKNLRSLWLFHREAISAIDELEMATERLRLREKFEPESATKILNVIEQREMVQHELKCSSDEIIGRDELRKKLGQLVYLTNLAKKNHDGQDSNPDTCPICQCELGVEWSVMMCGHCYCLRCVRTLMDRNLIGCHLMERRLKCPMCRHMTPVREISYVTTRKTEKVNVKGSHSTKIQAVIECLIKIREHDPTAKSLVFSVWVSVLDILGAALAENRIPYKSLHDPNYFQKNLTAFKSDESIQVLLLPLHTGANGLNLVEANHVLLVEPELNLEEEAQAISRICRIGQTRQTKIHRFLVRGTIEEKIFHMVKVLRESRSGVEEGGDTVELTVGHITSLLLQPGPDDDNDEDESENGVVNVVGSGSGAGEFVGSDGSGPSTSGSHTGNNNGASSIASMSVSHDVRAGENAVAGDMGVSDSTDANVGDGTDTNLTTGNDEGLGVRWNLNNSDSQIITEINSNDDMARIESVDVTVDNRGIDVGSPEWVVNVNALTGQETGSSSGNLSDFVGGSGDLGLNPLHSSIEDDQEDREGLETADNTEVGQLPDNV